LDIFISSQNIINLFTLIFNKYSKILFFVFLIYFGYEFGLIMSFNLNSNGISEKANELKKQHLIENGITRKKLKKNSDDGKYLFIIGDSYIDNLFQYGEYSYSNLFNNLAEYINYQFVDLSKSGTDFDYFDDKLKKLEYKNSILVYSFYIHDYTTITNKNEISVENNNYSKYYQFHGIKVLKNLFQKICMYFFEIPIPSSRTYLNFMEWDDTSKEIFSRHLSNIESRFNKTYLIINFPFNYKYGNKRYPSMDFLSSLNSNKLSVIFTNEIVKYPNSAGVIDGHPSIKSVSEVFKFIKNKILVDLDQ